MKTVDLGTLNMIGLKGLVLITPLTSLRRETFMQTVDLVVLNMPYLKG